ncbi:MAG: YkgJ family cysteine cluster protein [Planctomyces sp.]|nr:YkgJ family cysteine cluster protein [Planctomyces sp.]
MTNSDSLDDVPSPDDADRVLIGLEINMAGEKVEFKIKLPRGLATWDDLLPFMRTLIAVGSDISQEYFASRDKHVSCRAGCGICCRQRVPLAEFEAHRLRALIESMPEPRRTEVIARFRAAEQRIAELGDSISIGSDLALTMEEMSVRARKYFNLMIACPFLENESCSIYEERPLKCREYLVTSPAELCANPDSSAIVPLPLPLNVYMATLRLGNSPEDSTVRWVPLTSLMSWTDQHEPEQATRTGPELLHEFMNQLSQ